MKESSKSYDELRKLIRLLLKQYLEREKGKEGFGFEALCYQIMGLLSTNFLVRTTEVDIKGTTEKYEDRIRMINHYIFTNYRRQINIKELSESLFLSVGYLSRFFKNNYGMSFAEYVNKIRLQHALEDLMYTDDPITTIAYNNGFSNTAAFNKAFRKEYGDTPTAMRKKGSHDKEGDNKLVSEELDRQLEEFLGGTEDAYEEDLPAKEIHISSMAETTRVSPYWNSIINVGAAEELLRSEIREHIILMHAAFGFEYVRFWRPFDKDMLIDINNENGDYNFSQLNAVMDFLVEEGYKLHIELGAKPRHLQKDPKKRLIYEKKETSDSIEKWERLLHAFMNNIIQRYSAKEVGTWRFELWYEEDYIWNDVDAEEDYFRRFACMYRVIKGYSPDSEVGGCGMHTFHYADVFYEYMKSFYKSWGSQHTKPDFLSVMSYPYVFQQTSHGPLARRSTDTDFIKHGVDIVKKCLKDNGWEDLKIYITEWGMSISDRNYLNDTCYKGALIEKKYIELYGSVDAMGYFLGSDRSSEYYDTNMLLYGGNGLISKDGILKPAGFAFTFLNRLGPLLLGKGKNWMMTKDEQNVYGIICHNCRELNYSYYSTGEDEIEREHLEKYFEDKDSVDLSFHISDVEDGVYQVKTYRVNEKNGSVLNIWAEMEYEKNLSREDIRYFRRVCEPKMQIQNIKTENGILDISIRLRINEIAFIGCKKKRSS